MKTTLLATAILLTVLSPAAAFADGGIATDSLSNFVQASASSQPTKVAVRNEWYGQADTLEISALTQFALTASDRARAEFQQPLTATGVEDFNTQVTSVVETQATPYGPALYGAEAPTGSHAGHNHGAHFDGYCSPEQNGRDLKVGSARQFSDIHDDLYVKNDYNKNIDFLASDATGPIVGAKLRY